MLATEFNKLKKAKTINRKAIQRKGTGLTLSTVFPQYYTYIQGMTDTKSPDETDLINYVEDRINKLTIDVERIRPYAFRNVTCLQYLVLTHSTMTILENPNALTGTTFYIIVPSGLLSTYQNNTMWKKFKNRIRTSISNGSEDTYIVQHIDKVQKLSWVGQKKVGDFEKDLRI